MPMCTMSPCLISDDAASGKLPMKPRETAVSASAGHGKNQSMVGAETRPGNLRALSGNFALRGDMQSMRWRLSRTQSVKYALRLSCVSSRPGRFLEKLWRRSAVMDMISSFAKRLGTSPVIRTEFSTSRNDSDLISDSVNRKTVCFVSAPAVRYRSRMSSMSEARLYCLVSVIWKHRALEMYEASLVSDCLPDPPTPTRRPDPRGISMRRFRRRRCFRASSKRTRSIFRDEFSSLYLSRNDVTRPRTSTSDPPGSYTFGASASRTPSASYTSSCKKLTMKMPPSLFAALASGSSLISAWS
mmetsp:Transcript_15056/g.50519  ORF Transcript_15056/g.50519 Transcript_15056/m.50519 type:complete len:300 (+) Transcript_15056:4300-5199(+)